MAHIHIRGISPGMEEKHWEADSLLRIGRLKGLEINLPDLCICRRQAEIRLTENGWLIRDLDSRGGTFVNNRRLANEQQLRVGDILQLGRIILVVERLEDSNQQPPLEQG